MACSYSFIIPDIFTVSHHFYSFILLGFGDGSVKLFDIRTPDTGVATFSDMNSPILDCRLQVVISELYKYFYGEDHLYFGKGLP